MSENEISESERSESGFTKNKMCGFHNLHTFLVQEYSSISTNFVGISQFPNKLFNTLQDKRNSRGPRPRKPPRASGGLRGGRRRSRAHRPAQVGATANDRGSRRRARLRIELAHRSIYRRPRSAGCSADRVEAEGDPAAEASLLRP